MLLTFFVILLLAIAFAGLGIYAIFKKAARKVWKKLYYTVFWNLTLRTFLESYLPHAHQLAEALKEGYNWNSTLHVTLSLFSIFNLILLLLVPLFLFHYFRKNTGNFRKPEFRRKFGDSTDILSHRRRKASTYFLTFCYRRLLIVGFIVFAEKGYFQIMGTMFVIQFAVVI
jgi:hypothetical protein